MNVIHALRAQRHHNSPEGVAFRAARGDTRSQCACDMCKAAHRAMRKPVR